MKIKRIETNKFRTNEIAIYVAIPMKSHTFTKNAILSDVLLRGSMKYPTQREISMKESDMYGASIYSKEEKNGDYYILTFFMSVLANEYIPENINLAQEATDMMLDLAFNPKVDGKGFDAEYVRQEKQQLADVIEMRKDDKTKYAYTRAIEEYFKDEPYGEYIYGNLEDLEEIDEKNLYEYYRQILKEAKIYFAIEGKDANKVEIPDEYANLGIANWEEDIELQENEPESALDKCEYELVSKEDVENIELSENTKDEEIKGKDKRTNENNESNAVVKVVDKLDVTQGKINIIFDAKVENKVAALVYSVILGGDANSKLFQNVREKNGLAYTVAAQYNKHKQFIVIRTGIMLENFKKCYDVIGEQIEDMKNGKITDEELENAKETLYATIRAIPESQVATTNYEFQAELFNEKITLSEFMQQVKDVRKDDVVEVANTIKMKLVYYLTNSESND